MRWETQRLFGIEFLADAEIDDLAAEVTRIACSEPSGYRLVVTPNVDHLVHYERRPELRKVPTGAWINLPDGMPVVWSSRLVGRRLRRRLAGSDLFDSLWPRLIDGAVGTLVVAPTDEVADGLRAEYPAVATRVPPIIGQDDVALAAVEATAISETARENKVRVVIVALGFEATHLLGAQLQGSLGDEAEAVTVLLLGAAPMFHLGMIDRAPVWMQDRGLEWFHRLCSDPRRMARRYLVDDVQFAWIVLREWRAGRRR